MRAHVPLQADKCGGDVGGVAVVVELEVAVMVGVAVRMFACWMVLVGTSCFTSFPMLVSKGEKRPRRMRVEIKMVVVV